ncbi:MAG: KpsF/GutQ family sugar-phosphate isomerase [Planctomycetota bacterium]
MADAPANAPAPTPGDTPAVPPAAPAELARAVLRAEAAAISAVPLDDDAFARAARLIAGASGSVVVAGLGKSGLIGAKLSATFASTGAPSHFLHPVEAMHGDLGRVRQGDVLLALSYSGETEELVTLAEVLAPDGVPTIAIVGPLRSRLARSAAAALSVGDVAEACPHNLAPTASTTAMLALGDALALAVMSLRGFSADDFAKRHPGGGLGKLLRPVTEAMRFRVGENLTPAPLGVSVEQAFRDSGQAAEGAGLRRPGAVLVVDAAGKLAGLATDGDLRRALLDTGPSAWAGPIDAVMTANPSTLADTALVRDAVHLVRTKRFDEAPVVDAQGHPVGLIDVQDLAALKVIAG